MTGHSNGSEEECNNNKNLGEGKRERKKLRKRKKGRESNRNRRLEESIDHFEANSVCREILMTFFRPCHNLSTRIF